MHDRQLNTVDRLLAGVDNALRTIAAANSPTARRNPARDVAEASLTEREKRHAAGLMRVNHAGEIAAQGLYQGHAAIARDPAVEAQMRQAAGEEMDHLGWCEERLTQLGAGPSKLAPFWYAGAFVIGAASGALGDRWSLGFIEETERQVSRHLSGHLERLPPQDRKSRAIVARMREEEEQHGDNARKAGASELPAPLKRLMRMSARVMTGTAYWI